VLLETGQPGEVQRSFKYSEGAKEMTLGEEELCVTERASIFSMTMLRPNSGEYFMRLVKSESQVGDTKSLGSSVP